MADTITAGASMSRPAGPPGVTWMAPAKVNLYLHVVGRRDDGYHLLDSLIAFAALGDLVTVLPAREIRLGVEGQFAEAVPTGSDNLVLRAARALAQHAGITDGAAIILEKQMPTAAGLGGGSADAAAALRALVRLWDVEIGEDALAELGLSLGADVPICLAGHPAFVGGIGEAITPVPNLPPTWLVLVNPGVAVSTPAVFRAREGDFSAPARFDGTAADAPALAALLAQRHNDLTEPAMSQAPVIGDVLAALTGTPDCLLARMSGSGATCFGLFANEAAARTAARRVALDNPSWWVVSAALATPA